MEHQFLRLMVKYTQIHNNMQTNNISSLKCIYIFHFDVGKNKIGVQIKFILTRTQVIILPDTYQVLFINQYYTKVQETCKILNQNTLFTSGQGNRAVMSEQDTSVVKRVRNESSKQIGQVINCPVLLIFERGFSVWSPRQCCHEIFSITLGFVVTLLVFFVNRFHITI